MCRMSRNETLEHHFLLSFLIKRQIKIYLILRSAWMDCCCRDTIAERCAFTFCFCSRHSGPFSFGLFYFFPGCVKTPASPTLRRYKNPSMEMCFYQICYIFNTITLSNFHTTQVPHEKIMQGLKSVNAFRFTMYSSPLWRRSAGAFSMGSFAPSVTERWSFVAGKSQLPNPQCSAVDTIV